MWVQELGTSAIVLTDLAISSENQPGIVAISGAFIGDLVLVNYGIYDYEYTDLYSSLYYGPLPMLVVFDKGGNYLYFNHFLDEDLYLTLYVKSIAVLATNEIVAVGQYVDIFDPNTNVQNFPYCNQPSGFVAVISDNLISWGEALGTATSYQYARTVSVHQDKFIVGGEFEDALTIDCTHSLSSLNFNTFIISYDSTTEEFNSNLERINSSISLTNFTGEFNYPGVGQTYPNNADTYIFIQPHNVYHVEVQITSFSLSGVTDYIIAFDGNTTTTPIRYYNGANAFISADSSVFYDNYDNSDNIIIRSNQPSMLIYFHSDSCDTSSGFQIEINSSPKLAHCDDEFPQYYVEESGLISEKSKGGYRNNANCLYYINPSFDVKYIILDFVSFKVENDDYINIYDGNTPDTRKLLATFYGGKPFYSVQSTQREVVIQFVTNEKNYNDGWAIKYTGVTDPLYCGGEVALNSITGSFVSQTRSKYLPSSNCTWNINTDWDYYFPTYTFLYFPTLSLNPSSSLIVSYNESKQHLVQNATSSQLYISAGPITTQFLANSQIGPGFTGVYCIQSGTSSCANDVYTNQTATFHNHFCGPWYGSNAYCDWTIEPDFDDIEYIMVTFSEVDFKNVGAINDYLLIQDCTSSCRTVSKIYQSKEYYANNSLPVVVSTSSKLRALFESDTYNSGYGFNATFCTSLQRDNCSLTLSDPAGTFNNSFCNGYYAANSTCKWTTKFLKGSGISVLIINDLSFYDEKFNGVAWADNLYITDLNNELLYTLNRGGMFLNYNATLSEQGPGKGLAVPNPLILSFTYEVQLNFVSDDEGFAHAFNASYCLFGEIDARLCSNGTVYTSDHLVFGNQACNSYYQSNANCLYTIQPKDFVIAETEILLFFLTLNFQNSGNNITDYINVYDGALPTDPYQVNNKLGTFNSTVDSTLVVLIASQPEATIHFVSDDSLFGKGFVVEYCLVPAPAQSCGGVTQMQTNYSGVFSDHTCGPTYIAPTHCKWEITPPTHNFTYIIVIFKKLDIGNSESAIVTLYDHTATEIINSYPSYSPTSSSFGESIEEGLAIYVESSSVLISFEVQENSTLHTGWTVEYYTGIEKGVCLTDTVFYTPTGTITDHIYGDYYQNGVSCAFLITIANASRITVKFNYFNLEDGYDFLEVYDGANWTSELIGLYTGTDIPAPFASSSNSIYMIFTSDYSVISKGFSLYYSDNALLDCPLYCSNSGQCVNKTCICDPDRYGAACDIPPPPFVEEAIYTTSLSEILVSFSRDTNRANMYSLYFPDSTNCSHVLSLDTISKLGLNPTCFWVNDQILLIKLGYRSTILPNEDYINIIGGVLSDPNPTEETPIAGPMSIILELPTVIESPITMIVGSSTYRPNSPIQLNAFGSYVDGGRELTFSWDISVCGNCSITNGCQCTDGDSELEGFVSSITSSELEIPFYFVANYPTDSFFRISTSATNFLNITGDSFSFEVAQSDPLFPSVSILGPTIRLVRRGEVLLIKAAADLPSSMKRSFDLNCPDIQFKWEFLNCDPSPCPFEISSLLTATTSQLYLDTNALEFGGEYDVTVSVMLNQNTNQKSHAIVHITVAPVAISIEIEGGDQVISKDKDVPLVSTIVNPPAQYLPCVPSYRWSCRKSSGVACILNDNEYLELDNSPNVTLSVTRLLPGTYIFTSLVDCNSTTTTDEISLTVLRRNQTLLKIINPFSSNSKHNPLDPLVLLVVSAEENTKVLENINWSIVYGNVQLSASDLLSENANDYQLVIAPNILEGGTTIRFKVEGNAPGLDVGSAELEVSINDPPSPGIIYVDKNIGYSTQTEILFLSDGATDSKDDLPLRYIFGVRPINCANELKVNQVCPDVPLSNILEFPSFSAYLPPGTYYPFVDVIDRSDASTRLEGEEGIHILDSCPPDTTHLLEILTTVQLQMTNLACLGNSDQVRQLFNLANSFLSCSSFSITPQIDLIYSNLEDIINYVTSSTQITKVYLDNQIKSLLISSSNFASNNIDDNNKLNFLNSVKYASANATTLGFLRSDSAGSILNSLSNLLSSSIPTNGINSFTESITLIGSSALKQYSCNTIPYSVNNSNLRISSRKRSPSKLQGETISTSGDNSPSSSSASFTFPSSFSLPPSETYYYYSSYTEECVEYHAVDYLINPYSSTDPNTPLLSQTTDLTLTSHSEPISVSNLRYPIKITVPKTEKGTTEDYESYCGYWDEINNKWESDGCNLVGSDENYYYLEAYHLTSFAVLLGGTSGGGGASSVSFSIPNFDPIISGIETLFESSDLNEQGNLQSSFTEFSMLPPSAFGYANSEFISKVYNALNNDDGDDLWNINNILTLSFAGGAIVIFFVAIIILSVPPIRKRVNGSYYRKLRTNHSAKKRKFKQTVTSGTGGESVTVEEEGVVGEEDYWE